MLFWGQQLNVSSFQLFKIHQSTQYVTSYVARYIEISSLCHKSLACLKVTEAWYDRFLLCRYNIEQGSILVSLDGVLISLIGNLRISLQIQLVTIGVFKLLKCLIYPFNLLHRPDLGLFYSHRLQLDLAVKLACMMSSRRSMRTPPLSTRMARLWTTSFPGRP